MSVITCTSAHILLLGDESMKKAAWKSYVFWTVLAEAVGLLSGLLSRDGTSIFGETALQPPLSPPAILFPIVWTVLYALMGIGAARVSMTPDSVDRSKGLNLFVVQLIVNFFWSLIFFNAQAYGFAFLWLILLLVLVVWMTFTFRKTDPLAAALQIPYILWLLFAAYLNYGVWKLNT